MNNQKISKALKLLILILVIGVVLFFVYRNATKTPDTLRIGILQLVSHPSLDQIREGIISELRNGEEKLKKKIEFDVQNGQGDSKIVKSIADKFAAGNYALIIPITTPAAQAVANVEKKTPVVFGAVTDPIQAGIIKSLEHPGGNITGVSDLWPIDKEIALAKKIVPNAHRVGTVYNPGETNSQTIIKLIRKSCDELNLELKEATVAQGSEVLNATQSLVGKVDIIFTAADSTVGAAYEAVIKVARENKIPIFAGEGDSVKRGAIASFGLDYSGVGKLTGVLALKVLLGANPGDLPIVLITEGKPVVNLEAAEYFGVKIPEDILSQSDIIDPKNTLEKK
jgi:putative ABC transport system substrate-binding protein